jgi:alanyl-tRNA synthetase
VRAGGKHNDLENVGFTRRHHTFFEMLGNFSFGDYFKRDAIQFAWELVTDEKWFGIPKDRLYVTIFEGAEGVPRDDEAEQFWIETGVAKERIFQYGLKDNFWQMGETGPCGPCSEIFYDMGIEAAETPGVDQPFGHDDARYVEIWNLVFMQFERSAVTDANGKATYKLAPLPKPSIDTGMGLERVAAVLQGKISNFETDLFTPLIERAAELTGLQVSKPTRQQADPPADTSQSGLVSGRDFSRAEKDEKIEGALAPEGTLVGNASLRIIADHARAATFLINDGVVPSNEGRGYVLRKIMRRAIRHGRLLGQEKPFLFKMVFAVRDLMSGAYPELKDSAERVAKVVEAEEKQFDRVLKIGMRELDEAINKSIMPAIEAGNARLPHINDPEVEVEIAGESHASIQRFLRKHPEFSHTLRIEGPKNLYSFFVRTYPDLRVRLDGRGAFHLYETFGLPLDFMMDAARDAEIDFDVDGFEAARAEEQARARASPGRAEAQKTASPAFRDLPKTVFEGYRQLTSTNCEVLAIVKGGVGVPAAKAGDEVEVVLDHTSFYGDSGGQVGDLGWFTSTPDGNATIAEIVGCVLPVQGVRAHKAILKQPIWRWATA